MRLFVNSKKIVACAALLSMAAGMMSGMTILPVADVNAINPIVQDVYTADPAPMVCSDGRLYVYTSHDEDELVDKGGHSFTMNDWKCYSTTDMVNWTDHGTVMGYREFEWADPDSSWAGQVVERNGKFYYYVPINKKGTNSIAVGVSDSPTGPFEDPLGEPLLGPSYSYIDPTVFVDDDGQAYIYWGNPDLCCARLNDDMISYDKGYNEDGFVNGIKKWDLETKDFSSKDSAECKAAQAEFGEGTVKDDRVTKYEEGPWFYKRGDYYYMVFAANGIPERIDYSMSSSPTGPWEYKGMILDDKWEDGKGTGSFTNHPGVVDYKGHSYVFYHTGKLQGGGGYHRSVAVEEIQYNDDGTIDTVPMTADGVDSLEYFNPYQRVEAETMAYGHNLEKECSYPDDIDNKYVYVTDIEDGDYIMLKDVDFTQYGAVKFMACVSAAIPKGEKAGSIEVRLDSQDGELLCDYEVNGTESFDLWSSQEVDIDKTRAVGVHDLYFMFRGKEGSKNLFKFDYWEFTQDEVPATPAPSVTPAPSNPSGTQPAVTGGGDAATVNVPAAPASSETGVSVNAPAKVKVISAKASGKGKVNVKLKKIAGADGYRIAYSTNKSFKKNVKTISVKKTSVTLKKLKNRKIYYIKAQAYVKSPSGDKVYGKYGSALKVKVK